MLEILKDLRNREYKFLYLVENFFLIKALDAIINTFSKKQGRQFSKERKKSRAYLINIRTTGLEEGEIVTDHDI
jgi:hypothetical protein